MFGGFASDETGDFVAVETILIRNFFHDLFSGDLDKNGEIRERSSLFTGVQGPARSKPIEKHFNYAKSSSLIPFALKDFGLWRFSVPPFWIHVAPSPSQASLHE